ncbi:E3 ubiquitin-protein ligase bre1 [Mortierella sp. GBA43]|nr:E3 ubiquitin-protein ligase bre1 [Mortierella sp. GBA43]
MEDRSTRKRKLTDDAAELPDQDVSPEATEGGGSSSSSSSHNTDAADPLSKKTKLYDSDDSPAAYSSQSRDLSSPSSAEEVLNFQRDAIWRQMQEYKREYMKAQERISQLCDRQVDYEAHLSTIDIYWNKLLQDLKMLMARVDICVDTKDLALQDGTSFASFLLNGPYGSSQRVEIMELSSMVLKPAVEARSEYTREIVVNLLRIIKDWCEQRDTLWSSLSDADPTAKEGVLVRGLTEEHDRIVALHKKGQGDIDQLQAQCQDYSDQVQRLKGEIGSARSRLEEAAGNLDGAREKLRRIEKTQDRAKSSIVAAVTSGEIFGENYASTSDPNAPSSSSSGAGGSGDSKGDGGDASKDELLQYRDLAVARLTELEEMKTQRIQLRNEVDQIKTQLHHIPDEKLQDTQYVKTLLAQMQYARNDAEHYRNETSKLKKDLEELYLGRRQFMEGLETEEKSRRVSLENELKKYESEISRLRDSRDRFQQMYEARCTKDDYEMQQNQEIRKIANTRKDRITTLATDIQRLQIMLAANTGDKDAFAFYIAGSSIEKSFLDDLRNKQSSSEEQIKVLRHEIEAYKKAKVVVTQAAAADAGAAAAATVEPVAEKDMELTSEADAEADAEAKAKAAVAKAEAEAAAAAAAAAAAEAVAAKIQELRGAIISERRDPAKALKAAIQAREETIQSLEQKVKAHEAIQAPLLSELHTVASAWGQLEEATSRKVIDLAQKEDLIYKLLSDKTRQESKCNLLIRAKDASANMTAVMKRQSDMQLDQIRKLEERERNLNMQMATFEREQALLNSSVTLHKSKLQDCSQQNSGFKEKFARQEERLIELQGLLKDRTESYETEAHARRRLVEETDAMKRRLEEQAKAEANAGENSESAKQAARYLKLLKCTACDLNFKSHVIMRCMHVFCKPCMDSQLEFRQRKCPTCRESFGAKDVKEIYL